MSQFKKIIITLIVTIIAILGIYTISNAYYVGQNIQVSYNNYISSNNIFCMEHHQKLKGVMTYKIISQVRIEGTRSTDHTGKTIDNPANAKFAAILSEDNGSIKDKGPVANGIWNYGYTWMKEVGQYHAGLYTGFTSPKKGNSTWLDQSSTDYANKIAQGEKVIDNTNKDNIKIVPYEKDGKQYMRVGPFNWSFGGRITDVAVYDQNQKPIDGKLYSSFNGVTETWFGVEGIQSGKDFYISIPLDSNVTRITRISGTMKMDVKGVNVWFLEARTGYFQNLLIREPYGAQANIPFNFDYNISVLGNLKVIKVNKDNQEVKLPGVGFYIQNKNLGKYVKQEADGRITYVDTREQATEFVTDKNGEILIKDLVVGTYVAYETKNPNYGYEFISDGQETTIVIDKTTDFVIGNKQIYVKLSGYVWLDKISGKQSYRNDLFKDNDFDDSDMLLDGITVRLKDRNGDVVKEAKTQNGGAYLFTDVLIEKLSDYYIEFEYDGLTYTNVIPHIDKDNGSKSAENINVREEFNKNFSVVEGRTENTGFTRDANGNEKHNLEYNLDQNEHTATLINNGKYLITANTDETAYRIKEHFTYGQEEIKYINLGLYEREQPDIALLKDLQNVKVAVNGYNHIYNYSQRFENQGEYGDGFNVGVKFGNKYGNMSYTRAIYKADYEYINENDKSKELKVYATYRISLRNESSNLTVQVNNIVDYYDINYKLLKVGTGIEQNGEITGELGHTENGYNQNYSKSIINSNTKIEAQKQADIYVQFELNKEAVIKILNDKENLDNVAEINSYSVFDKDGKVYAGIDKDSNPGNSNPENKATFQDDTDSAPGLKLEVANARELTGKVFLDETSGELMTGKIRQGSGAYEDGEQGIEGVKITLKENTGSGKVYEVTTDANGDFLITDFIPGDYTLTYTWGDNTYTVQNYKATVYDSTRDQNNKNWYKENVDNRLSDALDNYELRQNIDNELKTITNKTNTTIDKMNSTTPTMGIGVEYETNYTASSGDRYTYRINNVDFGIVERPRQKLALDKRVKTFKVTLANGQVVADITIDEDGKITGEKNHITYMGPSDNLNPKNGFVRLELDNELIQGALLEVGYEIKATNISELDYLSENFYNYGKVEGPVVTITPTAIIDYLDKDWAFEPEKNTQWEIKSLDDIKDIVAEVVYNNEESTINEKTILYTESLKDQKLEPTKIATVDLNVSKTLTTTDEISLDNETEVVKLEKTGGSKTEETPGNYIPGTGKTEADDGMAETVIVTPSTGDNRGYIIPIMIGVTAFVILGIGIVLIKKKALK